MADDDDDVDDDVFAQLDMLVEQHMQQKEVGDPQATSPISKPIAPRTSTGSASFAGHANEAALLPGQPQLKNQRYSGAQPLFQPPTVAPRPTHGMQKGAYNGNAGSVMGTSTQRAPFITTQPPPQHTSRSNIPPGTTLAPADPAIWRAPGNTSQASLVHDQQKHGYAYTANGTALGLGAQEVGVGGSVQGQHHTTYPGADASVSVSTSLYPSHLGQQGTKLGVHPLDGVHQQQQVAPGLPHMMEHDPARLAAELARMQAEQAQLRRQLQTVEREKAELAHRAGLGSRAGLGGGSHLGSTQLPQQHQQMLQQLQQEVVALQKQLTFAQCEAVEAGRSMEERSSRLRAAEQERDELRQQLRRQAALTAQLQAESAGEPRDHRARAVVRPGHSLGQDVTDAGPSTPTSPQPATTGPVPPQQHAAPAAMLVRQRSGASPRQEAVAAEGGVGQGAGQVQARASGAGLGQQQQQTSQQAEADQTGRLQVPGQAAGMLVACVRTVQARRPSLWQKLWAASPGSIHVLLSSARPAAGLLLPTAVQPGSADDTSAGSRRLSGQQWVLGGHVDGGWPVTNTHWHLGLGTGASKGSSAGIHAINNSCIDPCIHSLLGLVCTELHRLATNGSLSGSSDATAHLATASAGAHHTGCSGSSSSGHGCIAALLQLLAQAAPAPAQPCAIHTPRHHASGATTKPAFSRSSGGPVQTRVWGPGGSSHWQGVVCSKKACADAQVYVPACLHLLASLLLYSDDVSQLFLGSAGCTRQQAGTTRLGQVPVQARDARDKHGQREPPPDQADDTGMQVDNEQGGSGDGDGGGEQTGQLLSVCWRLLQAETSSSHVVVGVGNLLHVLAKQLAPYGGLIHMAGLLTWRLHKCDGRTDAGSSATSPLFVESLLCDVNPQARASGAGLLASLLSCPHVAQLLHQGLHPNCDVGGDDPQAQPPPAAAAGATKPSSIPTGKLETAAVMSGPGPPDHPTCPARFTVTDVQQLLSAILDGISISAVTGPVHSAAIGCITTASPATVPQMSSDLSLLPPDPHSSLVTQPTIVPQTPNLGQHSKPPEPGRAHQEGMALALQRQMLLLVCCLHEASPEAGVDLLADMCTQAAGASHSGLGQRLLAMADAAVLHTWPGCLGSSSARHATSCPLDRVSPAVLCHHVRVACEALTLLRELLVSGSDRLRDALLDDLILDSDAQHAFHNATSRLQDWAAGVLVQPSQKHVPALPLACWAVKYAVGGPRQPAAGLPGGNGRAVHGTLAMCMDSVKQLALSVSRRVMQHLQQVNAMQPGPMQVGAP